MRKLGLGLTVPALLFAGLVFGATPAAAATTTVTPGSVTYTAAYTCTVGCAGPPYIHRYTASLDCTGALAGTGVGITDTALTELFAGTLVTDPTTHKTSVQYTATYQNGSGYVINATTAADPVTGGLTGTATGPGQWFSVTASRDAYVAPVCSTPVIVPPTVTPPAVTPPAANGDDEVAGTNNQVESTAETTEAPEAAKAPETEKVEAPEAAKAPEKSTKNDDQDKKDQKDQKDQKDHETESGD